MKNLLSNTKISKNQWTRKSERQSLSPEVSSFTKLEDAEGLSSRLGIPPRLWVRLCRRKSQFRRKTLPQSEQWYGLMSVWVKRWVLRFDRWLKLRLQTGHLWGDSSIWSILWTARVRDWQKPLPHSVHLNGFSLLWIYLKRWKQQIRKGDNVVLFLYTYIPKMSYKIFQKKEEILYLTSPKTQILNEIQKLTRSPPL